MRGRPGYGTTRGRLSVCSCIGTLRMNVRLWPPGRRSRAASGTHRAGSHHKLAPHSEITRSKLAPLSGTWAASASMSGKVLAVPRGPQLGRGHIHADWPGTAAGQPGGEVRAATAQLDDVQACHPARHP